MCFKCPPPASLFCYACNTTHQAPDPAPVPPPATPGQAPDTAVQGTLTASRASLSAMPDDIICRTLGFIPGFAPVLALTSCRFRRIMGVFPQLHVRAVFSQCPSEDSLLGRYLQVLAAHHEIDIQLMPHLDYLPNGTGTGLAQPLSDCNGILSRLSMNVHFSIVNTIRFLGVTNCPNTFLAPQEIILFSDETRHMQSVNLQSIWCRLRPVLLALGHPLAALPGVYASAQQIRTWMHSDANQTLLQGVAELNLSGLSLTCVPKEIALCTALQKLNLSSNRLVSLPPELFAGLAALQSLHLDNNQLVSLPPGLFAELAALQRLDLDNNRLVSLPPGLFAGLTALQTLYLCNNRLVFLPPELFAGLAALRWLILSSNRLVSLPPGLFAGLAAEGSLHLHGNTRLLISYNDLPYENNIKFRNVIEEFFNYECQSRLARLYQLAAGMDSPEGLPAVSELFSELPVTTKNAIYGLIWEEADRPNTGDPQWGEHHAFEDLGIFGGALKRYVRESFEKLTDDQKNAVRRHLYHLARNQRGAEAAHFEDPNWGEHHAFVNILGLIDAIQRMESQNAAAV